MVEKIVKDFCEYFTSGGRLIYVGDTDEKWAYFDEALLKKVGVVIEAHGKMPDVVVYIEKKNWLVLIEAVTSHGPVNPKRRGIENSFQGFEGRTGFCHRVPQQTCHAQISKRHFMGN